MINSKHESSLGLHPLVYFYTSTGSYQQTSFLSLAQIILELDRDNKLPQFISIRERFENFIIKHKIFSVQIIRKYGSKLKADTHLKTYYRELINLMLGVNDDNSIIKFLKQKFDFLNPDESELERTKRASFNNDVSNAKVIQLDLESCKRCEICGGRIHHKSLSKDHIDKAENNGLGNIQNLRITHPYCNTGYRNWLEHQEKIKTLKK